MWQWSVLCIMTSSRLFITFGCFAIVHGNFEFHQILIIFFLHGATR